MTDLDEQIARWRGTLRGLSLEQLDELEDHLRAECERLAGAGLSEVERVVVAAHRMGPAPDAGEASVGRRWRGVLMGSLLWTFALLAVYRVGFFVPLPGVDQAHLAEWGRSAALGVSLVDRAVSTSPFHPAAVALLAAWVVGLLCIAARGGRRRAA